MDAEKPHRNCPLSSNMGSKINVLSKPPSRDAAMDTDWTKLVADLERLLKLRSIPFGMKLFESREEMEAIPEGETSSRFLRDRQFWGAEEKIQPGKVVGWIFATEEKGARMK